MMNRSRSGTNLNEYEVKVDGGFAISPTSPLYGGKSVTLTTMY